MTKRERLVEFYKRLSLAPTAKDHDEAFTLIETILNAVEDELSGIPYDLAASQTDGRLYPPSPMFVRKVPGHPTVLRYRQRGHSTLIGQNGAIEIRIAETNEMIFSKHGADEKGVFS